MQGLTNRYNEYKPVQQEVGSPCIRVTEGFAAKVIDRRVSDKNKLCPTDACQGDVPSDHLVTSAMLLRHTSFYLVGRIATGIVGLVTLAAFTRVMAPSDYGHYSVIIAIVSLIAGVGFQWLRHGLVRFGTGAHENHAVLLGTLGLLFAALTSVTVVIAIILGFVGGIFRFHVSQAELVVICCLTFAQAWFELVIDAARTEFKPWRYGAATFVRALLCLVFGVAAAVFTHQVLFVVLGMAAGYIIASLTAIPPWLAGLLRLNAAAWSEAKRLASYGLPLSFTLGMTFVLDSADRLMLAGMRGYTEAGVYASAYNLAQFSIGTLLGGLGLGSLPLAVGAFRDADPQRAKNLLERNLLLGVGVGLPAVVGLAMIAPVMDRLLLGNYVAGRSDIVTMIVAVGVGFAGIRSYCLDVVFMLYRRTWVQGCMVGSAAILNVALNLVLIPPWGAIGAAFATLVSFASAMVASLILGRRHMKLSLPLHDVGKILLSCALLALVVFVTLPPTARWPHLLLAIVCGALVYALSVVATNAAGSRARIVASWRRHARSFRGVAR